MIRLTVDGHPVQVPEGATLLDAAAAAGIDIPTLCKVEGLPPLTSCYVCLVQVVGGRGGRLSPSCATAAEEGMAVITDAPEVRAARRASVELLLSDHLGECAAPCEISCPAGFRIPTFMESLAGGDREAAARVARDDLVLPAILGMICPRFCEPNCRRKQRDEAVSIAELHRQVGESECPAASAAGSGEGGCKSGKRVAVVGAGPAGLATAYNLLRRGHAVTILDARERPGGQLHYSIDDHRVPKAVLAGEIDVIRRMGAEFRMKTRLGRDVTLASLREEFDAVMIAVGAPRWQKLTCPGAELAADAGEVMARIAAGEPVDLGGRVAVVGDGQEAIEVARTARRRGSGPVTVLCSRPQAHLPLLAAHIRAAEEDGVAFEFEATASEISRNDGGDMQVNCTRKKGEPFAIDCDHLLAAMGRDVDLELFAGQGLEVGKRGVKVSRDTLATNLPGVFAGGDAVSGGGFCVRAIAYGQMAADAIDRFLRAPAGQSPEPARHPINVRYGPLASEEMAMLLARTANPGGRTARIDDDVAARAEAARCLMCGCQDSHLCRLREVATRLDADFARFKGERRAMRRDDSHPLAAYESHKCIVCGACVAIAGAERDKLGLTWVGRGFNVRVAVPWDGPMSDALGDLARRCAEACPTSAIVLKHPRHIDSSGAQE
ncbi:MAG: Ferredoxin--NADP reductase [Phycisphaerae bacterium]|nr:Ferredoxin--NADP reductase [Phycisphaerae bacterium]